MSLTFFHLGYQPREVQFAIVEQNPTLLNITLFPENNNAERLKLTFNQAGLQNLDGADKVNSELEDKLDELLGDYENEKTEEEEYEDDKIFGLIPNPLAKIQKDIQSNVDSFFANIPLIG